jgi:membrane associated rhomboid family serine protease
MRDKLREMDESLSRWFSPAVKWAAYGIVAGFVIALLVGPRYPAWFGASVRTTFIHGRVWQIVTFAFVTSGLFNIVFQLLTLWMFGTRLEMRWGTKRFIRFMAIVAAGTLATHLLFTAILGGVYWDVPLFGMAGVLFGLLGAYAYYWPDDQIYVYAVFPMKVKYWALVLGLMMFATLPYPGSQIGRLTQFGGLATAMILVAYPRFPELLRLASKHAKTR